MATLLLVATGLGGFGSIFLGTTWIMVPLVIATIMYGVIVALRLWMDRPAARTSRILRAVVPWAAGALTGLAGLTLAFSPGNALLGILPLPGTLISFGSLTSAGLDEMLSGAAPLLPGDGFRFLITLAVLLIAFVSAALVLIAGLPLFAILLSVAVYAAPQLVITPTLNVASFTAFALSILLLLTLTRPVSPSAEHGGWFRPIAIPVAAIAVITALTAAPALTATVGSKPLAIGNQAGPFETGINPMITLGDDLRRGANTVALTYVTTSEIPLYLRVFTIDDLDRTLWQPRPFEAAPNSSVVEFPAPPGLDAETPTARVTTTISIDSLSTNWLPLPYAPDGVTGLIGDWNWELPSLAAYSNETNTRAERYTVTSTQVEPSAEQLRAAVPGSTSAIDPRYRSLPDDLPASITAVMNEVTAGATTDYDRAMALQDYFRNDFTYSESAPVEKGFDGSAGEVIASFLERKTGYCVHFSSAMTVMSRLMGIPARIAVGYLPGTADGLNDDGQQTYRVTSQQLHAWPELYFEGAGWISFEPTTSRGVPAQFAQAAPNPTTAPTTAPTAAPTSAPSAAPVPTAAPVPSASNSPTQAPGGSSAGTVSSPIGVSVLGVLVLLVLIFGQTIARMWQRERRYRHGARDGTPAGAAWAELEATATDLGLAPIAGETARDFAARLQATMSTEQPGCADLLHALERESYGRGGTRAPVQGAGGGSYGRDATGAPVQGAGGFRPIVRDLARALRTTRPVPVRLREFFFPASLRRG
ncbi:transglutaminaseTgpA domain-containing protein [Mycetocola lacteus]|uniref:transglutaminase family protein n=1 Tax=Mycetocola lacteus TaxID=76637 RepID=UPI0015FF7166|nr:DUF3488 and transglutaminase-like domain-containing protein [Mycetocola lacteus]